METNQFQRTSLLLEQGNAKEAIKEAKRQLSNDPNNPFGLYLLALAQCDVEEEKKNALNTIQRALALEPQWSVLHVAHAQVLLTNDQIKKAKVAAETAISLEPDDADAHVALARVYLSQENWKKAEEALRQAMQFDPEHQEAANLLAFVTRIQGQLEGSQSTVEEILRRNPNDAFAHAEAGWQTLQKGDSQKALQHFKEALRLDPNLEHARRGMIEAYKARSPIYRAFLQYTFFMAKMDQSARIIFIIGLFLINRFSRTVFTGESAPIGYAISAVYLCFVFWTWLASGIGNFMLLFNSYARLALNRNEKVEAITVAGSLLLGIAFLVGGLAGGIASFVNAGVFVMGASLMFSCTWGNEHPLGKKLYGGLAGLLFLTGLAVAPWITQEPPAAFFQWMGTMMLVGVAGVWMGAFGVLRRA